MPVCDPPPSLLTRQRLLHDLRGAAHSLTLLQSLAQKDPKEGQPDVWRWAHERVFGNDGRGLVDKLLAQLGYVLEYQPAGLSYQRDVQDYVGALTVLLDRITAVETAEMKLPGRWSGIGQ